MSVEPLAKRLAGSDARPRRSLGGLRNALIFVCPQIVPDQNEWLEALEWVVNRSNSRFIDTQFSKHPHRQKDNLAVGGPSRPAVKTSEAAVGLGHDDDDDDDALAAGLPGCQ